MKKIFLTLLVLFGFNLNAQEINWVTLEEAVELQQKEPRKIIMDFYTKWCGPCKLLDRNTFKNKDVAKYINENYYAVKFNAEGNDVVNFNGNKFINTKYDPAKANRRNYSHQLTQYFQVTAYPTMVFLDEEDNLITQVCSFEFNVFIVLYFKMFYKNDYKNLKSQKDFNAYHQAFKAEFK